MKMKFVRWYCLVVAVALLFARTLEAQIPTGGGLTPSLRAQSRVLGSGSLHSLFRIPSRMCAATRSARDCRKFMVSKRF